MTTDERTALRCGAVWIIGGTPCGAPAVYAYGVLRTCGCSNSTVGYCCEPCWDPSPFNCAHCWSYDCCTAVEPVRIA